MPETKAEYRRTTEPLDARIEAVVRAYETLMHRITLAHAPEFLGVGLTMSQAKVLYLVQARPDIRMSEIATRLGVSLSTVSGTIDRLVDHGLLTRRDDPADRRQVVVRLTHDGATQLELLRELSAAHFREILTRVDPAELPVLERALAVLTAAAGPLPVDSDLTPGHGAGATPPPIEGASA